LTLLESSLGMHDRGIAIDPGNVFIVPPGFATEQVASLRKRLRKKRSGDSKGDRMTRDELHERR
jgi:hypothetical protein